jgi:uncharacterized protein YqiB (DUF1249 family)
MFAVEQGQVLLFYTHVCFEDIIRYHPYPEASIRIHPQCICVESCGHQQFGSVQRRFRFHNEYFE